MLLTIHVHCLPIRPQVLSGQLVAPGLPLPLQNEDAKKLVNTYGKTWHTWQVCTGLGLHSCHIAMNVALAVVTSLLYCVFYMPALWIFCTWLASMTA